MEPELGQFSHLIWGWSRRVKIGSVPVTAGWAAAASGPGFVPSCGAEGQWGREAVTPAHYGIRTRNLAWPLGS